MDDVKEDAASKVPSWLKKLMEESWQAEILISGGAFVGLLGSFSTIRSIWTFFEFASIVDDK